MSQNEMANDLNGVSFAKPKPKRLYVTVEEVENGFIVSERLPGQSMYAGKIWVAKNVDALSTVLAKLDAENKEANKTGGKNG